MKLNMGNQGISGRIASALVWIAQGCALARPRLLLPLAQRVRSPGPQGSSSSLRISVRGSFGACFLVGGADSVLRERTQSLCTRNERFAEIDFEEFRHVLERSEIAPAVESVSLGASRGKKRPNMVEKVGTKEKVDSRFWTDFQADFFARAAKESVREAIPVLG